jgi:hypothetical protein
MSSEAVRASMRAAVAAKAPSVPYFDSVNRSERTLNDTQPLPDVWLTLEFDMERRGPVTMGSRPWVEEAGTATVVVLGKSGRGDADVASAASDLSRAFDGWRDPVIDLWIETAGAPQPQPLEGMGEWWALAVPLRYIHQSRRTP